MNLKIVTLLVLLCLTFVLAGPAKKVTKTTTTTEDPEDDDDDIFGDLFEDSEPETTTTKAPVVRASGRAVKPAGPAVVHPSVLPPKKH